MTGGGRGERSVCHKGITPEGGVTCCKSVEPWRICAVIEIGKYRKKTNRKNSHLYLGFFLLLFLNTLAGDNNERVLFFSSTDATHLIRF